jgi:hypothetical protein
MAKKPENGVLNLLFRGFDPQIDLAERMVLLENKIKHIPPTMMVQEEIQPDLAEAILQSKNRDNRNIKPDVIADYTRHMINGTFRFSPASIIFTTLGSLADGQHRLQAILNSKVAQSMFVLYNAPVEIFEDVDRGKQRTLWDDLVVLREPRAYEMAKTVPHLGTVGEPSINCPISIWKKSVHEQREYWKRTLDKELMRRCIDDGHIIDQQTRRVILVNQRTRNRVYFHFYLMAPILYRMHHLAESEVEGFINKYLQPYSDFVPLAQDKLDTARLYVGTGGGLQTETVRVLAQAWNMYRVKLHPELEAKASVASNGEGPNFI